MKKTTLILGCTFALGTIALGCGSSSKTTGTGGANGTGGTAGSAGSTGTGGAAGSAGSTGTGGAAGNAGSTGTGGAAGNAGSTGTGGAAGSAGATGTGGAAGAPAWALTSPDFAGGSAIPSQYTCNGGAFASGNIPELDWTAGPSGAQSYAIVLTDNSVLAQNNSATLNHAFHWVIWDIPADIAHKIPTSLGSDDAEFPSEVPGARQWANRNQFGFFPPCPNSSPGTDAALNNDNYAFTLYAISVPILNYPAYDPNTTTNYTRTIQAYLEANNIGKTQLLFTSDAESASPPPAAPTILGPSARPGKDASQD
jgi:phosphatidylethanolamine-binding protein (PEBP) family uncharacterized protein